MKRFPFHIALAICCVTLSCVRQEAPTPDWEEVIASYVDDGQKVEFHKLARLNLALAETGQLADKVFHYTQAGSNGILVSWDLTEESGEILSDHYWSMGHVAYAQRMAFESGVLDEGEYNPKMIRRLDGLYSRLFIAHIDVTFKE